MSEATTVGPPGGRTSLGNGEKGLYHHHQGGAPVNHSVTPGGHPLDTSQPGFPTYHRRFANPAPLGLMSFGGTLFFLGMIYVRTRHITIPNFLVSLALAYGGLAQLLAGMWEFACGNTFAATAFTSYGAFFLSLAAIYIPNSGILAAYGQGVQIVNAFGIYYATWFIFTTLMLIAAFRSSWGLIAFFFFLDLTFLLLMSGEFADSREVRIAGGAFALVSSALAWYVGLAGLLTSDNANMILPVGERRRSYHPEAGTHGYRSDGPTYGAHSTQPTHHNAPV
ncbi:hypothetical protein BT69DRAFT_1236752 [Atractiella rhizophila]|nr:hypothetical protein BT69DRAFT_1236752 [Atractiella rhizophila]